MDELSEIPRTIDAGTTVVVRASLPDYPPRDGWTLTLLLRGKAVLDVEAAADGDDHLLTLTAADSAGLDPGGYQWVRRVARPIAGSDPAAEEARIVDRGWVQVNPDLVTATAGELQSHDEKLLALVEAELVRRHTAGAIESYQVTDAGGGTAVTREPTEKLEHRRDQLAARIAQRRRGTPFQSLRLRFAPRRSRA